MSIQFAEPPAGGGDIVSQRVASIHGRRQRYAAVGGAKTAALALAPHRASDMAPPYPIFSYDLSDFLGESGRPSKPPKPVGWRYLLVENDHFTEAADLAQDPAGGGLRFVALDRGPTVTKVTEAMNTAEKYAKQNPQETFELRGLQVPALYLNALWLKAKDDRHDLFIPLMSVAGLVENRVYSSQDLWKSLAPAAQKVKDFDSRPRTSAK